MKILYFVKQFAAPTLTFIYNELISISNYAEVHVITNKRINEKLFPINNVKEITFTQHTILKKILHPFQSNDYLFSYRNSEYKKELNNFIDELNPDIIHTHFGFESWWFLANLNVSNIPIFISFHGFDASHKLKSSRYKFVLKYFLKKHKLIPIFSSDFMAQKVEEVVGTIFKKHILYYGTNIDFFKRINYNLEKNEIKFLQVSSFSEKKGHEYTIKAFALHLKRNLNLNSKLILAGEGDLKESMIRLCKDLKIAEYVEFVGLVNANEAKQLMENSNIFVHHSITSDKGDMEGIPNAIMEAMSMELPILSTFHSGIPELVEHQINGLLSEEKNIEKYADQMTEILKWGYLSINREKIRKKFEINQHSNLLYNYYIKSVNSNT